MHAVDDHVLAGVVALLVDRAAHPGAGHGAAEPGRALAEVEEFVEACGLDKARGEMRDAVCRAAPAAALALLAAKQG